MRPPLFLGLRIHHEIFIYIFVTFSYCYQNHANTL